VGVRGSVVNLDCQQVTCAACSYKPPEQAKPALGSGRRGAEMPPATRPGACWRGASEIVAKWPPGPALVLVGAAEAATDGATPLHPPSRWRPCGRHRPERTHAFVKPTTRERAAAMRRSRNWQRAAPRPSIRLSPASRRPRVARWPAVGRPRTIGFVAKRKPAPPARRSPSASSRAAGQLTPSRSALAASAAMGYPFSSGRPGSVSAIADLPVDTRETIRRPLTPASHGQTPLRASSTIPSPFVAST
jgi:hypothetical protein